SAMKQSKQSYLPQINSPLIFSQWLEKLAAADLNQSRLFAHLSHHPKLVDQIPIKKETPIIIAIGPEGGFSENEARLAERCNFQPISLGNHILRTETAAVTAVAQVKLKLRTRG
ncbi:MAG: RsmE family RNA methyltransferase, partial [Calditrichae bacterium]|nr:RsmE family RNA methyltransferase [Calditrichia bacterium]